MTRDALRRERSGCPCFASCLQPLQRQRLGQTLIGFVPNANFLEECDAARKEESISPNDAVARQSVIDQAAQIVQSFEQTFFRSPRS